MGGRERGKIITNLHIHAKIAEHDARARERGRGGMRGGWKEDASMMEGVEEVPPHGQRGGEGREAERESRAGGRQRVRMYRAKAGGIGMLRESAERCFSRATALVPAGRYGRSLRQWQQREIAVTRDALPPRNFSRGLDSVTSVLALAPSGSPPPPSSLSLFSEWNGSARANHLCRVVLNRRGRYKDRAARCGRVANGWRVS